MRTTKKVIQFLLLISAIAATTNVYAIDEPPFATEEETREAVESFKAYAAAFQAEDYNQVWLLTDPRNRQWFDKKRWIKRAKTALKKTGAILSYEVETIAPVNASQLPCTEMGHCYRQGVQYVFILIRSAYGNASPEQPEFVVMSKSEEGWKFGGGTFPDTPGGETAVLLNRKDEDRYRYRSEGP